MVCCRDLLFFTGTHTACANSENSHLLRLSPVSSKEDTTVPYTSATRFGAALHGANVPVLQLVLEQVGHADFVTEAMSPARAQHVRIMAVLEEALAWALQH